MLGAEGRCECDHVGCGAVRRAVNNWYVVTCSEAGVSILHWACCTVAQRKTGKHFCGLQQAFICASEVLSNPVDQSAVEEPEHIPHEPLAFELKPLKRDDTVYN